MGHESGHGLTEFSAHCPKAVTKVWFGLCSHLKAWPGKNPSWRSLRLLPEFISCGQMIQDLASCQLWAGDHHQVVQATCSSLRLLTILCRVGCSNLVIYFIKPLCSAWWWNLIQSNLFTAVILKETIHYLSRILLIETSHKSHFHTSGWDYTKMSVYRVCLHFF